MIAINITAASFEAIRRAVAGRQVAAGAETDVFNV
jgi:hypothetical protein